MPLSARGPTQLTGLLPVNRKRAAGLLCLICYESPRSSGPPDSPGSRFLSETLGFQRAARVACDVSVFSSGPWGAWEWNRLPVFSLSKAGGMQWGRAGDGTEGAALREDKCRGRGKEASKCSSRAALALEGEGESGKALKMSCTRPPGARAGGMCNLFLQYRVTRGWEEMAPARQRYPAARTGLGRLCLFLP